MSVAKRRRGVPLSKRAPAATGTEYTVLSSPMKKSSLPFRLQRGARPPLPEIVLWSDIAGNDRTYTSERPVSFETYATQPPSSDK